MARWHTLSQWLGNGILVAAVAVLVLGDLMMIVAAGGRKAAATRVVFSPWSLKTSFTRC